MSFQPDIIDRNITMHILNYLKEYGADLLFLKEEMETYEKIDELRLSINYERQMANRFTPYNVQLKMGNYNALWIFNEYNKTIELVSSNIPGLSK